MRDYLAHSQEIRREIEKNQQLMELLDRHMSGENILQFIDGGTTNDHFCLGRMDREIYIAIREFKVQPYLRNTKSIKSWYESYSLNAEQYYSQGKRVTDFCIGAIKEDNAVLLIEDFSKGGGEEIDKPKPNSDFGFLRDGTKVHLDLDGSFPLYESFKYMDKSASIMF